MARSSKRNKFSKWLLGFTPNESRYIPDGPQRQIGHGGFFNNAEGFILNDPIMTSIQVDNTTVINAQDTVTQTMSLLSRHIIRGAAHDDSAREPPPRCHPETRVKLLARISAWFHGRAQRELLLWITGPAGVGKSAIVQTFAEYLVKSASLGASVFISRPNKRNKPQSIFITIAYQLATRIEEYRNFIVERLSLDPSLLNKGMAAQFTTFIVDPFVERKIGTGDKRWAILLDGLDELEGEDAQCSIIQLISTFALENRDAPLIWIIASRPESHISNMFDEDEIRGSCWTECVPIDSTEACNDVERFLRSSFKATQKKFRHFVPSDWPSNTDLLKLTAAASGLFIYAQVVTQFIRDSDHADPVSQLEVLLAIIDRSNDQMKENPFIHLDMLYNEILSSIPPKLWQTTKQLLAVTIHAEEISRNNFVPLLEGWGTLRGMSILFGITRNVIYACLNKCRSTLRIPDWKVAYKQKLTFFHASFADYLKDSHRSGDYYVGNADDVGEDVVLRLVEIWNEYGEGEFAIGSVESMWNQYCSKWHDEAPSRNISKFHDRLFRATTHPVGLAIFNAIKTPTESRIYELLRQVDMIKLCLFFWDYTLVVFLRSVMEVSPNLNDIAFVREIWLGDLKLVHLNWEEMRPAHIHRTRTGRIFKEMTWISHRPRSRAELETFMSELESFQECSPELKVVIIGGVPSRRVAAFCRPLKTQAVEMEDFTYYVIPYPEGAL